MEATEVANGAEVHSLRTARRVFRELSCLRQRALRGTNEDLLLYWARLRALHRLCGDEGGPSKGAQ